MTPTTATTGGPPTRYTRPHVSARPLLLALSLSACRTWPSTHLDARFVTPPASAACDDLAAAAATSGWQMFLSDAAHIHTLLLPNDETWVLHGDVEWIRLGGSLTLRRQRATDYAISLSCGPDWRPIALTSRTCRADRRVLAVVDPAPLRSIGAAVTPAWPCRLVARLTFADGRVLESALDALVRPSIRAELESTP